MSGSDVATGIGHSGEVTPVHDADVLAAIQALQLTGGGSGGEVFIFVQSTAATVWTIPHTLTHLPAVEVFATNGQQITSGVVIENPDSSHVTVTFAQPTMGSAQLR